MLATLADAIEGGIRMVLLREKQLDSRDLHEVARRATDLTARAEATLIVHDRADIALAVGAAGVHLGWRSAPLKAVRRVVGPDRLIGVSTHSLEEVQQASRSGADYVFFGPIFDTPSKRGLLEPRGLSALADVCEAVDTPGYAIGGFDAERARLARDQGAAGVAVLSFLMQSTDVRQCAARLTGRLD